MIVTKNYACTLQVSFQPRRDWYEKGLYLYWAETSVKALQRLPSLSQPV